MSSKRCAILLIVIFISFALLTVRLFYLQIISGSKLSKAASVQRMANSTIDKPRGDILDRNGIPFTNRNKKITIAIKPLFLRENKEELSKICEVLNLEYPKLEKEIEIKREPILVEADEEKRDLIKSLNIQGVSVINSLERYGGDAVARHLTGYLNKTDKTGEAGIEKFYEDVLKITQSKTVSVFTDARSNLLQGLGYRMVTPESSSKKMSVKLTLDYHIQKTVENVMERDKVSGAVVVEDVCTGDILAMASKPDFDQNEIDRYLDSPNNELFNKAVAAYNLGSIFKIIDIAQAMEMNYKLNNSFFCTGSIKIGDKEFKCVSYEKGGHGEVNLVNAFALSCNPYFIELGIKLGSKNILDMAAKFGLGDITGIKSQGIDEAPGNLPLKKRYFTEGDVANIAIGQGDIMATPLQVADMIATVANGGMKNKINIVDSIIDDRRNKVREVRKNEGERIISKETSNEIKKLMEEVTETGTGKKANLDQYGGAGGKTGSAETGQFIEGRKVVHAWFAGYFPKVNPKYSISVFAEDGQVGGQVAAPIFAEIAEEIMKKGF